MKSRSFKGSIKAACAMAAVATCWGVGQQAQAFPVEIPPNTALTGTIAPTTHSLTHVYLFYNTDGSGSDTFYSLPDAPAGVATSYSVDTGEYIYSDQAYTIIGVYDEANGLVSVSLNPDGGNFNDALGQSFDDIFGVNSAQYSYNEADIAASLVNGHLIENAGGAADSVNDAFDLANDLFNGAFIVGASFTSNPSAITSFSNAADDGTATAVPSPAPEPASLMLLAAGGSLLLVRRRRQQA